MIEEIYLILHIRQNIADNQFICLMPSDEST